MRRVLASRDLRTLLAGAGTCLALAFTARGMPALLRWTRDVRSAAAQTVAERARARESIARAGLTAESLRARNGRYLALAPQLLDGETAAGAGGALAALVSAGAASNDVRLGSVQIRADTGSPGVFTRISVRADVTGDVHGLAGLLATIEKGPPLLAIREISLAQPEPAAGDDRPEALRAELVIEGLMLTARQGRRGPQ